MSLSSLTLGRIASLKKLSSVWEKTASGYFPQRSLRLSSPTAADEGANTETQQISVEKIIEQYETKVDLSRLSLDELSIHKAHMKALKAGKNMYKDPITGFEVFSILSHLERGYCCGNACRHCAYSYKNVDEKYKSLKKHNTAFYN